MGSLGLRKVGMRYCLLSYGCDAVVAVEALALLRDEYARKAIVVYGLLEPTAAYRDLDEPSNVADMSEQERKHRKQRLDVRAQTRAACTEAMVSFKTRYGSTTHSLTPMDHRPASGSPARRLCPSRHVQIGENGMVVLTQCVHRFALMMSLCPTAVDRTILSYDVHSAYQSSAPLAALIDSFTLPLRYACAS
jgi:hypothetical protein